MSYINKPGKTSAWRKMVMRQQVSDVLAYGRITTTVTKAKETQRHVDRLISLAKHDTLVNRRRALEILLNTQKYSAKELMHKLFSDIATEYATRNGGYTRVLKLDRRPGDNTQLAVLALVK